MQAFRHIQIQLHDAQIYFLRAFLSRRVQLDFLPEPAPSSRLFLNLFLHILYLRPVSILSNKRILIIPGIQMSDHISLIEHTLGRHGDGMLFQFTDICTALHPAQYIIRICLGITVIAFHHIGERIRLCLLLHWKFTAVNDTCGMYVLTVFIINL